MAVAQQGAGHLGEMQVEVGQDEQFVPEDVTAVGLAVQAPGGYAHVKVRGVRGEGLQDVEEVQAQDAARLPGDVEVGTAPELVPGGEVPLEQVVEARGLADPVDGGVQRVADRRVVGGVQGDGLVDGDGAAWSEVQERLLDGSRDFVAHGEGASTVSRAAMPMRTSEVRVRQRSHTVSGVAVPVWTWVRWWPSRSR